MSEIKEEEEEAEKEMNLSCVDSDEDHLELMDNLMEKQEYNLSDEEGWNDLSQKKIS